MLTNSFLLTFANDLKNTPLNVDYNPLDYDIEMSRNHRLNESRWDDNRKMSTLLRLPGIRLYRYCYAEMASVMWREREKKRTISTLPERMKSLPVITSSEYVAYAASQNIVLCVCARITVNMVLLSFSAEISHHPFTRSQTNSTHNAFIHPFSCLRHTFINTNSASSHAHI